jgi:predicted methyltransferase
MDWETIKRWFTLGKELGFRLLREDCRHCNGKGICHSGKSEAYGISCASCQQAALGEIKTHAVRCECCNGRGIFVYVLPVGDQLQKVTIEVTPPPLSQNGVQSKCVPSRVEQNPKRMLLMCQE